MFKLIHSAEDPYTVYIPFLGRRLIFRNGKYDGWYHPKRKKAV